MLVFFPATRHPVEKEIKNMKKETKFVLGIDPGLKGAFCLTDGDDFITGTAMPIIKNGKEKFISFPYLCDLILNYKIKFGYSFPIFLEKPVSFGMGTKGAFNYGRGFECVLNAFEQAHLKVTLVEPHKWAKVMHEGFSKDLKPKVKSQMAVKKLFPKLMNRFPKAKNGLYDEGAVDALLIAGYGLRVLEDEEVGEF